MPLDGSAVTAAGLLQSALILMGHALEKMSNSKDPSMLAQCDPTKLIESQVTSIIASITKKSRADGLTDELSSESLLRGASTSLQPGIGPEATVAEANLPEVGSSKPEFDVFKDSKPTVLSRSPTDGSIDLQESSITSKLQARLRENVLVSSSSKSPSFTQTELEPRTLRSRLQHESQRRMVLMQAQEAFRVYDANDNGSLDARELRLALLKVGVSESKVEESLRELLGRHQGWRGEHRETTFKEFAEFVISKRSEINFAVMNTGAFDDRMTDLLVAHFNRSGEEKVMGTSKFLIDPRSRFSANWDVGVGLLLITTVITMPLSMAFQLAKKPLQPLDVTADVIFILDITKNFNCGYVNEFDYVIMDRAKVRMNYIYGWFLPDLFSSLPVELLDLFLSGSIPSDLKATKALKLLRLSRLAKIFRILKLPKLAKLLIDTQDAIEDHFQMKFDESKLAMGSLFVGLMVVAHWVGCISFMIASEFNFPEDSWVSVAGLVSAELGTQYSWTLFKALMMMIGVGFESPPLVNTVCTERTTWCTVEHWNTLICLYIGSVFYALLISSVSDIMSNMNKGGSALSEMLWSLNEFLEYKKVPMAMKKKVRSFYRIQYADGKAYDEAKILDILPPNIKDDIVTYIRKDTIDKIPLLRAETTSSEFVARIAPNLNSRIVFGNELIIKEDTIGDEMFFIDSGIVQIISKHCDFVIKALADGCYFGDVACMMGCKRTASVKSRTIVSLCVLNRGPLHRAFLDHPEVYKRMLVTAQKRQRRIAALDESLPEVEFANDDIEDEEDLKTKYFIEMFKTPDLPEDRKPKEKKRRLSSLLSRVTSTGDVLRDVSTNGALSTPSSGNSTDDYTDLKNRPEETPVRNIDILHQVSGGSPDNLPQVSGGSPDHLPHVQTSDSLGSEKADNLFGMWAKAISTMKHLSAECDVLGSVSNVASDCENSRTEAKNDIDVNFHSTQF